MNIKLELFTVDKNLPIQGIFQVLAKAFKEAGHTIIDQGDPEAILLIELAMGPKGIISGPAHLVAGAHLAWQNYRTIPVRNVTDPLTIIYVSGEFRHRESWQRMSTELAKVIVSNVTPNEEPSIVPTIGVSAETEPNEIEPVDTQPETHESEMVQAEEVLLVEEEATSLESTGQNEAFPSKPKRKKKSSAE